MCKDGDLFQIDKLPSLLHYHSGSQTVGREAFVRLVIKTPTGVPQHQFRRKSNARRDEDLSCRTQGRAHLRQSKVGRELEKFGNHWFT